MPDLPEAREVVLTASPLQRIGAFALATLAEVEHVSDLTGAVLDGAVKRMTDDLLATSMLAKAADSGGFWLSVSYFLWPNSGLNPTARGKQSPEQRRALISEWRTKRESADGPTVPCAYCGRAACDWFGKVDIPLGASIAHRNTTAPGHEGTPLCFPCVASLWAFPYGTQLSGGRSAAIHSWDDDFLANVIRATVGRTLADAQAAPKKKGVKAGEYARELWVWQAVRGYSNRLTAGVELLVLSNSNQEQLLVSQELTQPVAEWLRTTNSRTDRRAGYPALMAAHASKKVSGEALLARKAFTDPARVLYGAVDYLLAAAAIPSETAALRPLIYSYCSEVLTMDDKDVVRIQDLAARVASLVSKDSRPGPFRDFIRANSRGGNLYGWFRSKSVDWVLYPRPEGVPRVLLPVQEYRLLFEDERSWAWRRLLVFAVLEKLGEAGWEPKGSKEELQEIKVMADTVASDPDEDEGAQR